MSSDQTSSDLPQGTNTSSAIPPLGDRSAPTSAATKRPLFGPDGSRGAVRSQPAPPAGPPPKRVPSDLADALEMRLPLPDISQQGAVSSTDDHNKDKDKDKDKAEAPSSAENDQHGETCQRIDSPGRHARQPLSALAPMPESEGVEGPAPRPLEGVKRVPSSPPGEIRNRADPVLSSEIELAARKAHRVAEVRSIAQVAARVGDGEVNVGADDAGRAEIERALAAVEETRRKRVERKQAEGGGVQQGEEKLRRRQAKREQLMKKRKNMEERLEEEASKMAELTESAKKKGENKFMSEEAKRGAEERIRAEAEVVAQLERKAAEMALQRENMQKELEAKEDEKKAEIEASSSALKHKRALVEARMKQEEEEIKSLSETAKREVEAKMIAEAATIADMERQAVEMSAKRVELQAEMSNKLRLEDTMVQEAQEISRKREAMEAKMQQEEAELQKLSDEAKRRVLEKMAAEAAAIANMEKEANKLAAERVALASQIAKQRSSMVFENGHPRGETAAMHVEEGNTTRDSHPHAVQDPVPIDSDVGAAQDPVPTESDARAVQDPVPTGSDARTAQDPVPTDSNARAVQGPVPTDSDAYASQDLIPIENDPLRRAEPSEALDTTGSADGLDAAAEAMFDTPNPVSRSQSEELVDQSESPISGSAQQPDEISSHREYDTSLLHVEGDAKEHSQWIEEAVAPAQPIDLNVCTHCRTLQRDMSSAHLAAAAGHLACLEAIQVGDPSLLVDTDPAGRSPLFYACANAHADAADLLIREGPLCCHAMDVNRDTPLHAAALAGSGLCCRLLLQQGRSEVEPFNAMHMTPAHLAANNEVLEVLSQHGANLNEKDADSRTPLFVACATDRLEKAECLCELLECEGQDLAEADRRGDTPMHAAAYNGSTACLLLLLQYGVAPDVRNSKGLRPIDLAANRGQSTCEKILMEYQLHHHVDNSYFDSVLFLATLEGHKRCKAALDGDLQDVGGVATEVKANQELARPESLWSLRRGRSVRLEHWGDWISYEDQNEQSVFWYNHVAQQSQWDTPTGLGEASAKPLANASMRLKREGDWIEYTLPDGNVFYYNDKNNEFQWERPDHLSALPEDRAEEEGSTDDKAADAATGNWTAFKDPSTGLIFWYNQVTGESQWEPPLQAEAGGEGQRDIASPPDPLGNSTALEEEVREIKSMDELFTPR